MIKTESFMLCNRKMVCTYSDEGYMIERDGVLYRDAIDPVELGRTYTETTAKSETDAIVESSASDELVDIIMGKED